MKIYLDTSVLVAAITTETATPAVQAWLGMHAAASLAISAWSVTELHSALALKQRTGQIDPTERRIAHDSFTGLVRNNLVQVAITGTSFADAASLIDRSDRLRAGDALHLSIARQHGLVLATLDQPFLRAAMALDAQAISPLMGPTPGVKLPL
ncbi:MAG: type II toxin-antitoxin system VapC family toxin [Alphaproteobacteria bacterium]|nr:type II toxin-antitoxin system VapC family toxin [Alphaproteobacteria bacterium]